MASVQARTFFGGLRKESLEEIQDLLTYCLANKLAKIGKGLVQLFVDAHVRFQEVEWMPVLDVGDIYEIQSLHLDNVAAHAQNRLGQLGNHDEEVVLQIVAGLVQFAPFDRLFPDLICKNYR